MPVSGEELVVYVSYYRQLSDSIYILEGNVQLPITHSIGIERPSSYKDLQKVLVQRLLIVRGPNRLVNTRLFQNALAVVEANA